MLPFSRCPQNDVFNPDSNPIQPLVITGYNTDVEHDGVVYHVQTEDKGLENPMLLSLVYVGGTILASKRTSYQDLIEVGFDEPVLSERLQRQHRLICAAINAGRIDDLKKMTAAARAASLENSGTINPELISEALPEAIPEPIIEEAALKPESPYEFTFNDPDRVEVVVPAEPSDEFTRNDPDRVEVTPVEPPPPPFQVTSFEDERRQEEVRPFESTLPPTVQPTPKSPTVSSLDDRRGQEPVRPLETTIPPSVQALPLAPSRPSAYTVYDARRRERAAEGQQLSNGLHVDIIGDKDFRGGDNLELELIVTEVSSKGELPVTAAVSVKILGTAFRPVLLSLKTNRHGLVAVSTSIPKFNTGRAAIVIKAAAGGLSTETRRVIHPG